MKELALKVSLASETLTDYIHGNSDFSSAEDGAKPLIDYVHENYCSNRDVATGNYDCPYATTVMNTICCTGHECNHKGIYEKPVVNNLTKEQMCKLHSGAVYGKTVMDLVVNNLPDEEFPF